MPWPALKFKFFQGGHHIRVIMKRRINQQRPQSIDELKQTILNVWENVSYNIINALVAEMPQRLIQVYSYEWNDNTTLMK